MMRPLQLTVLLLSNLGIVLVVAALLPG